jgi:hypothetical protein
VWLDIRDPEEVMLKFAELMVIERVSPYEMAVVIDKIMENMKKLGML